MPITERATQLRSFWYPVARGVDVARRAPLERAVAGQRLALFRDARGAARALDARCPHRGGNLAQGVVRAGCVACPYHGWRFDGDGRCVDVPSLPRGEPVPARAATRSFPVCEQQGFVWVYVGDPAREAAPPPRLAALDDDTLRAFTVETLVELPFDWWVENILDNAHVPFVHRGTYGGDGAVIELYHVERQPDRLGFVAHTTLRQRHGLLARLLHRAVRHFEMRIRVEHTMPGTTVFDIAMDGGRRQQLVFFATPEGDARTRTWITVRRNYLRVPGGDAVGRWFTRQVVREDVRLARAALAHVSLAHPEQVSVPADEPALEFTRLLRYWREREAGEGHDEARATA